ncbi:MAG: AAA family ATPase, partial [Candidatus Marinimicrobia bacterium]|nr:AAA family ATPase [Candidatus Neomarinimicrobiota bacterium]
RYLYNQINFNQRLIGIIGARGVGKTTLLLQYLITEYNDPTAALYVSADNILVNGLGMLEIVAEHQRNGGKVLVIDEIHKLHNWVQIVKTIYDAYPEMNLIISGSSAFQIKTQGYDLSRRLFYYTLSGLSFREFVSLKTNRTAPVLSLSDILTNHSKLATELSQQFSIFPLFREYLQYGFYPFWQEGKAEYPQKIENILNKILYEDIPSAFPVKYDAIRQLKRFLYIVATSNPFQVNVAKLSRELQIARESLYQYLDFLDQSFVIHRLWKHSSGKTFQRKPEKLLLHNPNIISYLQPGALSRNKGIMRETFFVNQMMRVHTLYSSSPADFEDDLNNQFEIGGKSKRSGQLDPQKTGYLVLDDMTIGDKQRIPLYLFGFLY